MSNSYKVYASEDYVDKKVLEKITAPVTATIGQALVVRSVDENSKPVEWETKDMPNANIIYSETEPEGVTGRIWLKPI